VIATAAEVLAFWFGAEDGVAPGTQRPEWFRKSEAFDALVRQRFGATVEAALAGDLDAAWGTGLEGRLALLIVLDQFPRNLFRGSARAFAGDARALALARALVADGDLDRLAPLQIWFACLPFEHAEDLQAQDECVRLLTELSQAHPDLASALDYAERHRDAIRRYGRFPHRNAVLGRVSSAAEAAYLAQPGAGF